MMQRLPGDPRYFTAHLIERRKNPGDDLISYLTAADLPRRRPFTDNHVIGTRALLLVAGIDTTWSAHRLVPLAPGQDARRPPRAWSRSRP